MPPPRLIALCGNPGSGKSTAAKIICDLYGHKLVDDGLPLRQIAMTYLGLTKEQVFTQAGKSSFVTLNSAVWQVRDILGRLGNAFEAAIGGDIIPIMSHNLLDPAKSYVMGSVRREQGHYWAKQGALVLEIVSPIAGPSSFDFDRYSASAVHRTIHNSGPSLELTEKESLEAFADQIDAVLQGL